jgi:hypothetical protein
MGHGTRQQFFLHDLGDKRNSFCILMVVEIVHGMPAVTIRLGRSSTVAGTPHGGAPTPRTALAAAV